MAEDTESATDPKTDTAAEDDPSEAEESGAEEEIPPMPTRQPPKVPRESYSGEVQKVHVACDHGPSGEYDPWALSAEEGSAADPLQVSSEQGSADYDDSWECWAGVGVAAGAQKVSCDHGPSAGYDVWAEDVDEPRSTEKASAWTEKPRVKDDPWTQWSGMRVQNNPGGSGQDISRSSTDAFSQSWQSQSWEGWSAKSRRSGSWRDRGRMMEVQTAGDVLESKKAKFGIGRPVKCRACDWGKFRQ